MYLLNQQELPTNNRYILHIMKTIYEKPELLVADFELEGFICESIKQMKLTVEVDEHENMGTFNLSSPDVW